MAQHDLVLLDECKDLLGIPQTNTEEDQRLLRLITMCSAQLESYLNNYVILRSGITQEFLGGMTQWYLDYFPVSSITSIADGASNELTEAYDYMLWSDRGIIKSRRGRFSRAVETDGRRGFWTVTYNAGRYSNTGAVGADFKLATVLLVAGRLARPQPGVSEVTVGDLRVSYTEAAMRGPDVPVQSLIPEEVEHLMAGYVNRSY